MARPRVLVLTGYGINCDEETCWVFNQVGGEARIVHVNDLVDGRVRLADSQILAVPGGFSYGDDTGSGKALANRLRNNLSDALWEFAAGDRLVIGICNGFQVLTCLGLLPSPEARVAAVGLSHNAQARYECRWVDLRADDSPCVFTRGLTAIRVPVAHGEGRFTTDASTYAALVAGKQIALRYALPDGTPARGVFPYNPNGSMEDVAGICDSTGRIFGLMPHPERAFHFLQRDDWPARAAALRRAGREVPEFADGQRIFANAIAYFG
jgi:phosphoribosylformylglycinamidine synthase subunit PurQ / glutaminase